MKQNRTFNRIFMGLVFLFLYAPIFVLITFSFNANKSRTVWGGFSLQWYTELLGNSSIMNALQVTIMVSVISAIIATILGTMAAIGFTSMKRKPRAFCLAINNIPMTNADIVTGVSLMLLFVFMASILPIRLGFGTLLIAHITFNIPYVILSVMPKLRQLDPNIYEAAQDLGATGFVAFRKVVLPEIMPGVLNGLLIAFTMSFDDFVISYFAAGSGISTLAMEIYSMVRLRVSPEINALSTLMFLVVLLLLIVINLRQSHQDKSAQARQRALTAQS